MWEVVYVTVPMTNLIYQLSTAFSFFCLVGHVYPIIVGLLRLIFVGADSLSGHVAWIVMELSRLLFARPWFGSLLLSTECSLNVTSLQLPCPGYWPDWFTDAKAP
jgi:hypothetical protein